MALHQEEWQFVEQWPFAEAVLDATMDDAVLQMMSTRIQSAARGRAARKAAVQKMTALSKWAMARKFAAVALVAVAAIVAAASAGLPVVAPVMRLLGAPVAALRLLGAPDEEPSVFPVALRASGHMVGPAVEEEAFPEIDWTGLAFCVGFVLLCLATELLTTAGAATPTAAAPPATAATAPARRTRAATPRAPRPTRVRARVNNTTRRAAEPDTTPPVEPEVIGVPVAEPVAEQVVTPAPAKKKENPWVAFQKKAGGAGLKQKEMSLLYHVSRPGSPTLKWNQFQSAVKGNKLSPQRRSVMWAKYKEIVVPMATTIASAA